MMKSLLLCAGLLATTVPALTADVLASDVQRFIDRREGCDHMRGEVPDPGEKQRMKDVNREIRKLCKGTDRELAGLKKKYKANPSAMRRLNEFEEDVEAVGMQGDTVGLTRRQGGR